MKSILLVSSVISAVGNGGHALSESTVEYASQKACAQAVEIRTGKTMTPTNGGLRLEIPVGVGNGKTVFVCSPYGSAADE
jgi:hypothetical protein